MHGAHRLEAWSVMRKVRALSSGKSEFQSHGFGAGRELLMKHIVTMLESRRNHLYFTAILLQIKA